MPHLVLLPMDRAYERDETRQFELAFGMIPVVQLRAYRVLPWDYDRATCRKRNEV